MHLDLLTRLREALSQLAGRLFPPPVEEPETTPDPFPGVESPWSRASTAVGQPAACNICQWTGASFAGRKHSESATCPACGSIARDRFLLFCLVERMPPARYRVLETSPRLGEHYQRAMARWFDYRASDFDQQSHRTDLKIDLQEIALPTGSVDVLLTPHVLEHLPETDRALDEIHRILTPGGRMYLQVPVLQGATARPATPEFHGDNTPVEWRFGPDLTARLRAHGFRTRLLCTEELYRRIDAGSTRWPQPASPEFDVEAILAALAIDDLEPVADDELAALHGFEPAYMFLTWEATKGETRRTAPAGRSAADR